MNPRTLFYKEIQISATLDAVGLFALSSKPRRCNTFIHTYTLSEKKMGLCGNIFQTGGEGLVQIHYLISIYQIIFGMEKSFWGAM